VACVEIVSACVVFSEDNTYTGDRDHPISEAVLLELDAATGRLLRHWAASV